VNTHTRDKSVVVVPGFAMDGSLHAGSMIKRGQDICLPIVPLVPMVLPNLQAQAKQVEAYLAEMGKNSDVSVLIGFSTGADIVMELIIGHL
jgi:hypothetical protein